jgi:hypothetical protein
LTIRLLGSAFKSPDCKTRLEPSLVLQSGLAFGQFESARRPLTGPPNSVTPLGTAIWSNLSIYDRLDVSMWRADIQRSRSHQPIMIKLLDDVSGPPSDPGHGKDRRVKVDIQTHVVV